MHELPREIGGLLPWMPAARWYPARGREGRIVLDDAVKLPAAGGSDAAASTGWLAIVGACDGGGGRFVLPLAEHSGVKPDRSLVDAASSPDFVAWLLRTVLSAESLDGGRGVFRGRALPAADPAACPAGPPGEPADLRIAEIGADASNTSLAVGWTGGSVVVKLVRQCREGVHPEIEIGAFLAAAPVTADVPRLLGWLEYIRHEDGAEGNAAVIATVHDKVDAVGSAWDVMLELAVFHPARCLAMATLLGETTARLHAALASGSELAAFSAEPWTSESWGRSVRRMADHAAAVIRRLEAIRPAAAPGVAATLDRLLERRGDLLARFDAGSAPPTGGARIRVHGDYHLGQVLVSPRHDRCTVIDFEGEPSRSLSERREKTSAAKDVAGMCRSFDYLLRVLAKEGRRPYRSKEVRELESAFLAAYESASRRLAAESPAGVRWWPEDRAEADRLLVTYTLDKAVYELAYEADHRPDWIDVPLGAVAALITPPIAPLPEASAARTGRCSP